MTDDTRPLHVRIKALSDRYAARAIGARKIAAASQQDATNAQRDADTLAEAAVILAKMARDTTKSQS